MCTKLIDIFQREFVTNIISVLEEANIALEQYQSDLTGVIDDLSRAQTCPL